jgi:DNA helicase-2/ATP-dependent DNA helicase PcrA
MSEFTFTPSQQEAIDHLEGPRLVLAGAGTGKTRVITERIAKLILEHNAPPTSILALTFTEKAAAEMEERLDEILPYGMFGTTINTFHGFCQELVKRHPYKAGIEPTAQLATPAEVVSLARREFKHFKLSYYRPANNPVGFLSDLLKFTERAKEEGITSEQLLEVAATKLRAATSEAETEAAEESQELAHAMDVLNAILREANLLTYGDLISLALKTLKGSASARKEEQDRFKYILVDEFQDTNTSQAEITYLIAGEQSNIFVVGDDDQAIYRFRGANIENILQFRKQYPKAPITVLTENFRSTQPILDAAYKLIQHNNPHRLEAIENVNKKLTSFAGEGNNVAHLHFANNLYEIAGVADRVEQAIAGGQLPNTIALLARGHNHLTGFEQELNARGIATIRSKSTSFYQQPAVERVLSYLKFLQDPHHSVNLFFLLSEMPFNVPLSELREYSVSSRKLHQSLWEVVLLVEPKAPELTTAVTYLSDKLLHADQRKASEAIRSHVKDSLIENILVTNEDAQSLNQLNSLYHEAKSFEQLHRPTILTQYLSHVEGLLASGEDLRQEQVEEAPESAVQLMTVHASKGLEFTTVFVVNMVMDRFPGRNMGGGLPLPEELVENPSDQVPYEEERRLAYVAMTRAREQLFLTSAAQYQGNKRPKKPSVFLVEALGVAQPAVQEQELRLVSSEKPANPPTSKFPVPTVFTASALEAFEESPATYLKEHVYRLSDGENAYASFGTCIHAILHTSLAAKKAAETINLEDTYKKLWDPEGFESAEVATTWFDEGLTAVKNYLTIHSEAEPELLETGVQLTLPGGAKIVGKVDRIDRNKDGTYSIIDYKTGRKDAKPADVKNNLPVALYAAALVQQGKPVSSASLHYVMTGAEPTITITKEFMDEATSRAEDIIAKIVAAHASGDFPETTSFKR